MSIGKPLSEYTTEELLQELSKRKATLPKVVELTQTCYACPSQWDGMTEHGEHLYIRYRWGHLAVHIGVDTEHGFKIDASGWGGMMSETELMEHTQGILNWDDYR